MADRVLPGEIEPSCFERPHEESHDPPEDPEVDGGRDYQGWLRVIKETKQKITGMRWDDPFMFSFFFFFFFF